MKCFFSLIFLISILQSQSYASSCIGVVRTEYAKTAKFAFIGRVTKIDNQKVYMDVLESFHEPVGKKAILDFKSKVRIAGDPHAETYSLEVDYFIASDALKNSDSGVKVFRPHICEIQKKVSEAKDLILIAKKRQDQK